MREQAKQLVNYVTMSSMCMAARVLLTYEWMPVEEHVNPFVLMVVFHHADQHSLRLRIFKPSWVD